MRRVLPVLIAFFALPPTADAAWVWPVSGDVITPYRNGSDPYATGQHRGIDIAAPVGTTVRAAAGGAVRFAGTAGSSGLTIGIRTSDGYDTSYLHLSALQVRAGAHVSAGERIGAIGTTGTRSAAAPHLHFGVRDAGTRHAYHDPLAFLPPGPPASPAPGPPAPAPVPAPEPGPPRTVPTPEPVPPPPAPIPAIGPRTGPVPAPQRSRPPHGAPRRLGAAGPHAAPLPFRRRLPFPASSPSPMPGARSSPHPAPPGSPRRNLSPRDAPRDRAMSGTRPSRARSRGSDAISLERALEPLRTGPMSADPPDARPRSGAEADRGAPDIGWVLACAGLLLAAAVLGLTEDGRRGASRTRSKLLAALPAFGRR